MSRRSELIDRLRAHLGISRHEATVLVGTKTASARRWLIAKWLDDPHCYWCGCITELVPPVLPPGAKLVSYHATRDHLISRTMGRKAGDIVPIVLACHSCNGRRGSWECTLASPTKRPSRDLHAEMLRLTFKPDPKAFVDPTIPIDLGAIIDQAISV